MKKQSLKTFLRNFYLSSFLYSFVFAYAIYTVFFSINGLSVFQISILLMLWSGIAMLFEIPSGALADYWSRKNLLILAPLLKSICFPYLVCSRWELCPLCYWIFSLEFGFDFQLWHKRCSTLRQLGCS